MKRWPAVASFVLFIALCASVAYWAMQLFKPPMRPVAAPPPTVQAPPRIDAAAGLFGGRANTAVASNYQLKGVVMSGNPKDSVAILSADGKPAQAVRASAEVAPGVTVKEVHREYVLLSDGGVSKRVELPADLKGQGGMASPDMSGRPPVSARATAPPPPSNAVSAADARRSAMAGQIPPQAAQPVQPPEQSSAPGMGGGPPAAVPGMAVPPGMNAPAQQTLTSGTSGAGQTSASGAVMQQPAQALPQGTPQTVPSPQMQATQTQAAQAAQSGAVQGAQQQPLQQPVQQPGLAPQQR